LVAEFSDSAGPGLIAHTSEDVKDFARFYFRPLTPTQWHNEGLGRSVNGIRAFCPVPVFFRLPLEAVLDISVSRCAVSSGNLASSRSHFGNSENFLQYFDDENLYAVFGSVPLETYMSASQQEFLVHRGLDLANTMVELVCRDEQDLCTLQSVLAERALGSATFQITVDSKCFYADAPRLGITVEAGTDFLAELTGCRSSVEGTFTVELPKVVLEGRNLQKSLNVTFERRVALAGALDKRIRAYYSEKDQRRLVYAAEPTSPWAFT
jgi:hypothetical protein